MSEGVNVSISQSISSTQRELAMDLMEHSQLAHMRIGYHFIADLHITETRQILFLTRYDKINIIGLAKGHSKTGFQ